MIDKIRMNDVFYLCNAAAGFFSIYTLNIVTAKQQGDKVVGESQIMPGGFEANPDRKETEVSFFIGQSVETLR